MLILVRIHTIFMLKLQAVAQWDVARTVPKTLLDDHGLVFELNALIWGWVRVMLYQGLPIGSLVDPFWDYCLIGF